MAKSLQKPPPPAIDAPRLLIAMPAAGRDLSCLDTAARLAQITGASLRALLIEDPALAQAAELPLTREYDRRSGSERAIDAPRVTRHWRARQRAAREHLRALTEALQLSSKMDVARGEYLREALRAALDADFALIDPRNPQATSILSSAERRWLLGNRSMKPKRASTAQRYNVVWVIHNDDTGNDRALTIARSIAVNESAALERLGPTREPSVQEGARDSSRAPTPEPSPQPSNGTGLIDHALRTLPSAAQSGQRGLLVLARQSLRAGTPALNAERLARLTCPVLLVG